MTRPRAATASVGIGRTLRAVIVAPVKRQALGGAHRGPVAPTRQRRTIRFVQLLLTLIACGCLVLAGYNMGRVAGYEDGRRADSFDAPREPSTLQTIVLVVLGATAAGAALLLQGDGTVRVPTPARLDELAGRAESVAVERAEAAARENA